MLILNPATLLGPVSDRDPDYQQTTELLLG